AASVCWIPSVVAVCFGRTATTSDEPARTKHNAVSGIIGIPPGFHSVMMGRLKDHPAKTSTPRSATMVPATTGTRSKKPIEELRRPDGLGATSLGFAMLRVGPKNLFGKVLQCNSTTEWFCGLERIRQSAPCQEEWPA